MTEKKLFSKIKAYLATIGLKTSDVQIKLKGSSIVTEDESAVNLRKRIHKAFDDQQSELHGRGLVPHSAECQDPLSCVKQPCFKWEPDKIVRTFIVNTNLVEIKVDSEDKKS